MEIATARDISERFDEKKYLEVIYTKDVRLVPPNESLSKVLKIMAEKKIGYIPVVDEEGVLVGLITRSSLINVLGENYF